MDRHVITFLLYDGVKQLDVAGPAEVFAEANRHGANYELRYVSPDGAAVHTSIGLTLQPSPVRPALPHHTLVVPGADWLPTQPIPPELLSTTAELTAAAERVASVCTGAFLLAAAGSFTGERVTTHWAHAALLARSFPALRVTPDALFVHDGKFHTSAGVSSGIDLALALVTADHGTELARTVAQQLVVYVQRPGTQSQFSALLDAPRGSSDAVRDATAAVLAAPEQDHSPERLARSAGLSARQLTRRFAAELGTTPAKYVEAARLELAKTLLLRGDSIAEVARTSGFHSPETLRRVFVTRLGVPPSGYQQRFGRVAEHITRSE